MPRLYDRVIAGQHKGRRFIAPDGVEFPLLDIRDETLRAATVFVADNVGAYYFEGTEKDAWTASDFPVVVPPVNPLWIEFRATQRILSTAGVEDWPADGPRAWAWLIVSDDIRDRGDEYGWTVNFYPFLHYADQRGVVPPPYMRFLHLRTDGGAFDPHEKEGSWGIATDGDERHLRHFREDGAVFFPALLALSFMHCKNVAQREVAQPAFERQVWRKKHKRPLVRYKVLDIDPMKRTLASEGGSETGGLKKALHICRGHFVTYTEEKPLFGKVSGTFWKPQHIRGSKKEGLVLKDYRVHPKRGAQ